MDWLLRYERPLAAFGVVATVALGAWAFTSWEPPEGQVLGSQNTDEADEELLSYKYIVVQNSCGPDYQGTCVAMRSGPGTEYDSVLALRTGMVLKVAETLTVEGREWHKIQLDQHVRYPERVASEWYVAASVVQLITDKGDEELPAVGAASSTKYILVDRSEQKLYAYDGATLFMEQPISTGLELTPTPRGNFTVYKKTPSRYMQGPLPGISDQYYDLPGVPWNLYFTPEGGVIHGAYWHNSFGQPWSHGCVNLNPENARILYYWADIGTPVTVRD